MTTMTTQVDAEARSIAEQAAEWLLILEEGKPEDNEAFSDWLARSPLHVGAFLRASAVDSLLGEVDRERSITIDTGPFRDDRPDIAPPPPIASGGMIRAQFGVTRWAVAACACLIAIALGATLLFRPFSTDPWTHFASAVGEQRVLELKDGSVMYLSPGSSVDALFSGNERSLTLIAGGAMFKVHRDATRPFRVRSGRSVIQAVGTQFSVNRVREGSVVSVVEGVVQVSHDPVVAENPGTPATQSDTAEAKPVQLTAGQEARIARNGEVAAPKPADMDPVKDWKERRLTFINETLFTIADEFNRYNRAPKIRVEDAIAGEQRYAAAFDADDPASLVVVLEKDPRLQVQRLGEEISIRAR